MCILAFMIAYVCKQWASDCGYTIFLCSDKILSCWSGGNCFPFFFGIWYNEEWKEKKKFSVVEGKQNQKKWETYCHFPICVLIPSISLRCQHHYHRRCHTNDTITATTAHNTATTTTTILSSTQGRLKAKAKVVGWWGQDFISSLLNPPNPLILPLVVIMFTTSPFSTLLSPSLHQRFFFFFEKIYLIRISRGGEWMENC